MLPVQMMTGTFSLETVVGVAALLLLVSVFAMKLSGRVGLPALLTFLVVGMLAGSDGPGGIYFDDPGRAQAIAVIALVFILFSGGLDTSWSRARAALRDALLLATVGVVLTTLFVGGFAWLILKLSLMEALLLGAILASTDAAAVFATLRSRGLSLPARLQATVELESGSNDPMAVFLTTLLVGILAGTFQPGVLQISLSFLQDMIVGGVVGFLVGRALVFLINRLDLEYGGLYFVVTISAALFMYAGAELVGGNGFLAVYAGGVVFGTKRFLHRRTLGRFHDALAWLMQIAMFLTLGLLVFPSRLPAAAPAGLAIAAFLALVARPAAVLITLLGSDLTIRERLLLSWMGLRGAVPIVLATFPLLAGLEVAPRLFDLVFFAVLLSVAIQGPTIGWAARLLGVAGEAPPDASGASRRDSDLVTIAVDASAPAANRPLVELAMPEPAQVLLIHRSGTLFVPEGRTTILPQDKVMVLASRNNVQQLRALFSAAPLARTDGSGEG